MKITSQKLRQLIKETFDKEILGTEFINNVVNHLFKIVSDNPSEIFNEFLLRAQESAYVSWKNDIDLGMSQYDDPLGGDRIFPPRPDLPLFIRILFGSTQLKPANKNLIMETLYLEVIRRSTTKDDNVANLIFDMSHLIDPEIEKTRPARSGSNKSRQAFRLFSKAIKPLSENIKYSVIKKAFDLVCKVQGFSRKEAIKEMLFSKLDTINQNRQARIAYGVMDTRSVVEEMIKSLLNIGIHKAPWRGGELYNFLQSLMNNIGMNNTDLSAHPDIILSISNSLYNKLNHEDIYAKAIKEDIENFIIKLGNTIEKYTIGNNNFNI